MGRRKFSDRPSPVRQRIHDADETQQWSAAISSWIEDERLQASVPASSSAKENNCCSANSKHNKEAGPARCRDRTGV